MSTELITGASAPTIKPGFCYLPESVYHAANAVSQSRLKTLAKSPAHLKWELANPKPPTDAMKRGTMIHKAILEPGVFDNAYVVVPDLTIGITTKDGKPASSPKATAEYKERLASFASANVGRTFIDQDDWDMCQAIRKSLYEHPTISAFIEEAQGTEVTGFWNDPATGLLCKMRVDADCPDLGTIFDIKTTQSASVEDFERTVFTFRYYWQAAMYMDGMAALGRPRTDYVIIAVETEAPYQAVAYNLKAEIIDLARKEIAPLMQLYKHCLERDEWPGYPPSIVDIGLPAWAKSRIERAVV